MELMIVSFELVFYKLIGTFRFEKLNLHILDL